MSRIDELNAEFRAMRQQARLIAGDATDQHASQAVDFFPVLTANGELVKAQTRINWKGALKRAKVDLWDRAENDPDHAPTLWDDVLYLNGVRVIPFPRRPLTTSEKFAKDELGFWEGDGQAKRGVWKSPAAGTVWGPGTTGVNWTFVRDEP